jgi:Bacterial PH domain
VDNHPRPRPGPRPNPGRPAGRSEARLVPDRRYTALAAGGMAGALGALAFTTDSGGRLLAAIAAAVLLVYVVCDLVFSPRVIASPDGIVINAPLTRARLRWSDVEDVRPDTRLRLGLRSTNLEIDAGSTLAVLSRRAIGMDPLWAADLILAFRPAGSPGGGTQPDHEHDEDEHAG